MAGVKMETPTLTVDALWRLKEVEQAMVDVGDVRMGDKDGSLALLELLGQVSQTAPGAWALTERGWGTVQAFRRHVAANREALSLTGILPPFTEPPSRDDAAERRTMARDMFVSAFAVAAADADPATLADRVIGASQAFLNRKSAAGL
jgi:hypothetical protein